MRRALALAALGAALLGAAPARSAHAQEARAARETPPIVHYGKWGAAALFAAFTSLGVMEHNNAEGRYHALQAYCIDVGPCAIGADGRYANPEAESRYQSVVKSDRAARGWLLSGQLALAGAAALFVIELLHDHGTRNVPYSGLVVEPGRFGATNVGIRIPTGH